MKKQNILLLFVALTGHKVSCDDTESAIRQCLAEGSAPSKPTPPPQPGAAAAAKPFAKSAEELEIIDLLKKVAPEIKPKATDMASIAHDAAYMSALESVWKAERGENPKASFTKFLNNYVPALHLIKSGKLKLDTAANKKQTIEAEKNALSPEDKNKLKSIETHAANASNHAKLQYLRDYIAKHGVYVKGHGTAPKTGASAASAAVEGDLDALSMEELRDDYLRAAKELDLLNEYKDREAAQNAYATYMAAKYALGHRNSMAYKNLAAHSGRLASFTQAVKRYKADVNAYITDTLPAEDEE